MTDDDLAAPQPQLRDITAAHIHDARCDDNPCYDANMERHRHPPTEDDYVRAHKLLAALGAAITSASTET